jgi:hypothetical protein
VNQRVGKGCRVKLHRRTRLVHDVWLGVSLEQGVKQRVEVEGEY